MDFQKIASTGTAVAVVGTGAVVGGGNIVDNYQGGPQKREDARIEQIRQIVAEEIYIQLKTNWPATSGPVKGLKDPKDYKKEIPKQ
mgnify:FL=1|tara:strand:+ start:1078 stop:1335 length:258 start_codon:yes stop_codon:yes gene_type:complete